MSYWWEGRARERFWLESTDREDIGADLRAPDTDDSGEENWRYGLFRAAGVGDIVFHYNKRESAITAVSRIAGVAVNAPIVWAARGSYARKRRAAPVEVPGYRIPLVDTQPIFPPVTLDAIRSSRAAIEKIYYSLANRGVPLYFPFELSARPIRPLQGYAFKLPSSFVENFPELNKSVDALTGVPEDSEQQIIRDVIAEIEARAEKYEISKLQTFRALNRGLKRVAKSIFGNRLLGGDWTFHFGGRDELQFNIGFDEFFDGSLAFRSGVAFSFEPSRSLPAIDVLIPKVAKFNACLRDDPDAFSDLNMWHWKDKVRSDDRSVGPIPPTLVRPGVFVFLGIRQPVDKINPDLILRTFDRLFPLYCNVEAGAVVSTPSIEVKGEIQVEVRTGGETLRLGGGREISGGRWINASTRERSLDIYLRHQEIQRRLKAALLSEGCNIVELEVPIGNRSIDAVACCGPELWFYEVKAAPTVRSCLREAIGQLLEYALWPGATRPDRLIVVGEPALDINSRQYLKTLNETLPIPIAYRQLALD